MQNDVATRRMLLAIAATIAVLVSACGGEENSCKPPGFTNCAGNTLQTCVRNPMGEDGKLVDMDCTAKGFVCTGVTASSCKQAQTGSACFARNAKSCTAANELVRCVWVSEEPSPNYSGDIGLWRVEQGCAGGCAVSGGSAACSR